MHSEGHVTIAEANVLRIERTLSMEIRSKRKWKKVDQEDGVGLYQNLQDFALFQIRSRNDEHFIRRVFRASSVKRALAKIPEVMGMVPEKDQPTLIEIGKAFDMALERSNRGAKSRKDWHYQTTAFMAWLDQNYPNTQGWGDLTRSMVWEYLDSFRGKAANTRRLALQPICQTSGFMHREHGFFNIAERLGIGSKLKTPPAMVYLADVRDFCDRLADQESWLEVGVALQGLAGLRVSEVLRLTWDRVDLETGVIEISGNIKNEYSRRVIPVPDRVLEALRKALKTKSKADRPKIQLIQEPVISTQKGDPYKDYLFYALKLTNAIKAWNPRIGWKPKDLRNALPTFGTTEGVWNAVWEQYVGHAPGTVTTRHYVPRLAWASSGEKEALKKQMDLFRLHVVGPVNKALKKQNTVAEVQPTYNNGTEAV